MFLTRSIIGCYLDNLITSKINALLSYIVLLQCLCSRSSSLVLLRKLQGSAEWLPPCLDSISMTSLLRYIQCSFITKRLYIYCVFFSQNNTNLIFLVHCYYMQGFDALLLLASRGGIVSKTRSKPNKNPVKGFEVIDQMCMANKMCYSPNYLLRCILQRQTKLGSAPRRKGCKRSEYSKI